VSAAVSALTENPHFPKRKSRSSVDWNGLSGKGD